MARAFFALWPTEDVARELALAAGALAERTGGRPVPRDNIHLTLAFLGEIAPERVDLAQEAAAALPLPPFSLVLDRLDAFREAHVAWAGSSMPDPALTRLQGTLEAGLRARRFALEARAFAPHVTLVRRIEHPLVATPFPPIAWRATDFVLAQSRPGSGRYEIVERWPLAG
jgi:2'-5' RNA ligase